MQLLLQVHFDAAAVHSLTTIIRHLHSSLPAAVQKSYQGAPEAAFAGGLLRPTLWADPHHLPLQHTPMVPATVLLIAQLLRHCEVRHDLGMNHAASLAITVGSNLRRTPGMLGQHCRPSSRRHTE
jgi:hypothetical protein